MAYRTQLILTPHALLTAVLLNDDLELRHNPSPRARQFAWFLAGKSNGEFKIGVAREAAEDCVNRGLINKRDVE